MVAVWVRFGFQLGFKQTEVLIIIYTLSSKCSESFSSMHGVDYYHYLSLPKVELKTKTNPNDQHSVTVWDRFAF